MTPLRGARFRFQDLEIWVEANEVGRKLCLFADEFEGRKQYRFAEQLRGAALSVSNNIAEGSGSTSTKEFQQFLNYARRSVFENANMLLFFQSISQLNQDNVNDLLNRLDLLSARILSFSRSLSKD